MMTTENRPMSHYAPLVAKPQTPEQKALMRVVEIYLKCDLSKPCPDDCKLLRRRIGEWAICAHLREAGELMLKREAQEDKGCYNTRTGGYVKGL